MRVLKSCKKRKQQERPGGHWVNMEKNDWQDQKNNNGSDFMKVVQDAINSGDYQQLNEQVRKTVLPYRKCTIWVENCKMVLWRGCDRQETDCRKV